MTLTLEQFRERVVDYLYGELEGEELRVFEAALAESEACRRELAALQRTLGVARQGLRGPLSEEPPARVRSAVLAAAAQEVRSFADQRARPAADQKRGGGRRVLDALHAFLRTPWLFPALGAAAALLFVVLRERADHLASSELAAPGQAAAERAAPVPDAPAPSRERSAAEQAAPQPAPSSEMSRPRAAAPSRARREAKGYATPPRATPQKAARGAESFAEASRAGEGRARESEAAVREEAGGELARTARAPEPPPTDEAPAAAVEARAGVREHDDRGARADKLAVRAPEPPPSPAAAPGGRSFAKPPPASAGADAREEPSASTPAAAARDSFGGGGASPRAPAVAVRDARVGRAELAKTAREHVLAGRWQRAAEAYGELLRRFPDDREAPEWRKQIALARQALGRGGRDAAH